MGMILVHVTVEPTNLAVVSVEQDVNVTKPA